MAAALIYSGKWLLVKLPLAALALVIMVWLWMRWLPMPPSEVTISSGLSEGVYHAYAQRYAEAFARNGVKLTVAASEGAEMNLQRLRGNSQPAAEMAFIQGGMGESAMERAAGARLETLARVDIEPLWIFTRVAGLDALEQLQGLRVSLGPRGSGTRKLALLLLEQVRLGPQDIVDSEISGMAAVQALKQGTLDAVVMVSGTQSLVVKEFLRTPGVSLVQLRRSAALTERLPYLQLRLLPQGALDAAARLPARDVALLVTTSSLVARADLHPALQRLAAEVALDVHAGPGPFHRAGYFPSLRRIEFPASEEARRTFVRGRPWLEQHLPFWWAQLVIRLLVICLPIALAAIWLGRVIPGYLRWLIESKVARWYGELKFIEHDLKRPMISGLDLTRNLQRLDSIEKSMATFATPSYLMPRWFTLRQHIGFVRSRLIRARGR